MFRPRRCRGAAPFAAVATVLVLPVPVALAGGQAVPEVGSVTQTTGELIDGGAVLAPPIALPQATPLSTGATSCAGAHARPSRLGASAARAALMCAINRARAAHGLPAFGAERHLRRAATRHARDMVRHRYFAHQRAGGPSLSDRLRAAGWHGHAAGEAIAWGCGKPANAASTVRAWLHSPPHRAILLGGYNRAGVGVRGHAPASCGPGATWVLDAGA
jgi:uncharacterized protein YkwD